jgi:hypothetical protein
LRGENLEVLHFFELFLHAIPLVDRLGDDSSDIALVL